MRNRKIRMTALVTALLLLFSLLPHSVRAEQTLEPVTEAAGLVSGQYVLLSSEGYGPGVLNNGWLTPVQPQMQEDMPVFTAEMVWTLDVSPEGVLLTDSAGNTIAPAESQEMGLVTGSYRWQAVFDGSRFSFRGMAGDTAVGLARCDDLGFRAYDSRLIGILLDGGFILFRVTETTPEDPGDPPEDPEEPPQDPEEPPQDPEEPPQEPEEPPEDPEESPQDPEEPPEDPEEPPQDPEEPPEDPEEPPQDPEKLSQASEEPPEDPEMPAGPGLFFGQLHSHTAHSGAAGTPAEAYTYAKETAGLDFLAITDYSHSFDGEESGILTQDAGEISPQWKLGREASAEASTGTFLALYGFEMAWQNGLGHISTFFTPGFQSRNQEAYANYNTALENYYQTLAAVPGSVSQFNHPGTFYGDFEDYGHYSPEADAVMQLFEVACEGTADYEAYTRALDKGWHVAPTNNQNNHNGLWGSADSGRTVVYAEALTEEAFASALRNRRVYASEDQDLEIYYQLEGYLLGTMLHRRNVGDTVTLTARIADPTDGSGGTVEVIVDGGQVAASAPVSGEVVFTLPSSYRYYYLRLTQSDGDVAMTAPVWIEQRETMQVKSLETDTLLAVREKPVTLRVEVENRDGDVLTVDRLVFSVNGETVKTVEDPGTVDGNSTAVFTAEITCAAAGPAQLCVEVAGNIQGQKMSGGQDLSLTFVTEDMVTTLVADGSHGTLPALTELEAVAASHAMTLVRAEELTPEILSDCDFLLIPAPERDLDEDYVNLIRDYLDSGRTVILCGQADAAYDATARLNALAEAMGLTARFRDDTAFDPVNNGAGTGELYTNGYPGDFQPSVPFCQLGGCTLDPGSGTVLVKGLDTTFSIDGDGDGVGNLEETYTEVVEGFDVVRTLVTDPGEAVFLTREQLPGGGTVYVSGGMFLEDNALDPGGSNPWDEPNGNGYLLNTILSLRRETVAVGSVEEARKASLGATVRVCGYVTAGTAVPGNCFPGMIYIQDETGGLGVLDFTHGGVSVGTPLELYLLRSEEGFRLLHWEKIEGASYNILPRSTSCAEAANYENYPEMLIKTEGKVISRTLTQDGKGVSSFVLEDRQGGLMTVLVEESIQSAATGENTLAEIVDVDNWVSAIGIQYRGAEETVLRVRNCDEVVLIREKEKVYPVTKGENTIWHRKDGKSVYMEVEGPGEEFLGIEVDGEMISQSYYQTTEHDRLYFRIWPRYLNTLELGKHTVVFKFRNGEARATLEIRNEADIPYTGDGIGFWLAGSLLSGLALLDIRKKRTMR